MLETVCKTILDALGSGLYNDADDLPKLYHKTAERLKLAPSQHTEEAFKAILGSCQSVVNNLGTLRSFVQHPRRNGSGLLSCGGDKDGCDERALLRVINVRHFMKPLA